MAVYKVVGAMSGSSLDGLDLAMCELNLETRWTYKILEAETVKFDRKIADELQNSMSGTAQELAHLDKKFGDFIGENVHRFVKQHNLEVGFVASHGHTVFHQPKLGFTCQIGSGAHIAKACALPVVCDFRSGDVAAGGDGAPLVPIGDELLFSNYAACLNIGGIANISYRQNRRRIAYDISLANMMLNYCSSKLGFEFDQDGEIAANAKLVPQLLEMLNNLKSVAPHRSLGREDFIKRFQPILDSFRAAWEDKLRTVTQYLVDQLAHELLKIDGTTLITGGGAHNNFVTQELLDRGCNIEVPDPLIVDYKEALIFAFLGVLRIRNEVNSFSSVTGAKADGCNGCVYLP